MSRSLDAMWKGALAGGIATLPMSGVMLAAEAAGLMGKQPPELIVGKASDAAGVHPDPETRNAGATVAHIGFGVLVGSVFGLLSHRLELPVPPVVQGIGYGLLVYALNYGGWIPALHIMPPPQRDRPGRQPSIQAAHVVYGAVLGELVGRRGRAA